MKPQERFLVFFFLFLLFSSGTARWGPPVALGEEPAGPKPAAEARSPGSRVYHLDFSLQVMGNMTLLSKTRFCSTEDLHLKLAAAPGSGSWTFRLLGLEQGGDCVNFGIGEGPKRHQRYVLLTAEPSGEQAQVLEDHILAKEALYGCAGSSTCGTLPPAKGTRNKKSFFNYYLLENPLDSFRFVMDPQGKTLQVENQTKLKVLSEPGGRKAHPRFFELLEYSLLCMPPFSGSFVYAVATDEPVQWEMPCRPILDGLIQLVRHVYGRKMSLLDPGVLNDQKVVYQGHFVPSTQILWAQAKVDRLEPVPIRVSGFRGTIWIESFRREIYLDVRQRRILKDAFEISFGIVRDTKIFPVSCEKNVVRVVLVEECFLHCAPTDKDILRSSKECAKPDGNP